jgi:ribosomal protein S2
MFAIELTLEQLLIANAHVGNVPKFLNIKIKPYLLGKRNNFYLFDIKYTFVQARFLINFLINSISLRNSLLIVKERDPFKLERFLNLTRVFYYDSR